MEIPPPIRVLYLDHTAQLSGGELALARLLGALDRARVTPIVVLAEAGPLQTLLTQQSIETHVFPLAGRLRQTRKDSLGLAGLAGQLRSLGQLWKYARQISRFARTQRVDLLYTNSLKSGFYGVLAGLQARIPVIWHIRDRIDKDYLPTATVRLVRLMARRLPACVVANSTSTLETLRLGNAIPTEIIASGLTREYIEACRGPRATHEIPQVGIVGRIARWKGQDLFLEAAAQVLSRGIAARFHIVGAPMFGEESFEQELHALVRRKGLEDNVKFLGFSDVPSVLRSLDLLVHASRIPEPFGQVIVEGLAAELPVIATDGGGAREIVEDGRTGLLVPMGDAEALARAMTELLTHPQQARELAVAGRKHVLEYFTVEKSARRSEALYVRLLHPPATDTAVITL